MAHSREREETILNLTNEEALTLGNQLAELAFDRVLSGTHATPGEWLDDHDTEVTVTLSAHDAATTFTALMAAAGSDIEDGFPRSALDYIGIAENLTVAMVESDYAVV